MQSTTAGGTHRRLPTTTARYALFEFTGALPRAKLYSNWQVNTNRRGHAENAGRLNFDPAKTVLVATPEKICRPLATNENSGTVEFKSYAPKHIVFDANAPTPSVLLLNDKYDPNWRVTVDGQPAELLRCNFIMRGVFCRRPAHGRFRFQPAQQAALRHTGGHRPRDIALTGLLVLLAAQNRRLPPQKIITS